MIGTYASAILISLAAIVIGRGICVLSGHEGSTWLGAAVGLAALMVVCEVSIRLPGRGWTAVAAVLVACAASIWVAARSDASWPPILDGLVVALVVLILVSIPFIANARVGVLGISFLNDTHWHLILAEGLRRPAIQPLDGYGPGYPLGPHAIAATFAQGLGSDVDTTLTGVLMATPIMTGLAALGALGDLSRLRRWLVAVLAALPYLAAAFYAESAFKEPILSLLMLGLVLALQIGRRERPARPATVVIPVAVLVVGVLYVYSYPGLVLPVAIVACWLALELVVGGAWRRLEPVAAGVRAAAPALGVGALLFLVLALPDIGRIRTFWLSNGGTAVGTVGGVTKTSLSNLNGPLRPLEGLNLWPTSDFRLVPSGAPAAGVLAGLGLVVLLFALVCALERRELVWPGAILGFALVYIYLKHTQSPYVASKALAIPAPLLMLGSGAALMRRVEASDWLSFAGLGVAAVSLVFFYFAFDSVYLVLSDARVGPVNHLRELRALRPLLHDRPTLALFYDDYTQWELLGVPVSSPLLGSPIPAPVQPAKPWSPGQALDFDSVDASTLDRFDYVITTRTSAQSEPPANFHLVGSSRSYDVWQRVGPTLPRPVLPESGRPGAILDCHTSLGRRISQERGVARVRAEPRYFRLSPLVPGASEPVILDLPAGNWELSLPFVSPQAVNVRGGGMHVDVPPNLDHSGEIWPVGPISSSGAPIALELTMADPSPITPASQVFRPQPMVAVSAAPSRTVPLSEACGRYVDWYQLG